MVDRWQFRCLLLYSAVQWIFLLLTPKPIKSNHRRFKTGGRRSKSNGHINFACSQQHSTFVTSFRKRSVEKNRDCNIAINCWNRHNFRLNYQRIFKLLYGFFNEHLSFTMDRRFAPNFCFLLLWVALANGALAQTGGQAHQLRESSLISADSTKSGNRVKRSLSDGDKQRLNSG